MMSSDVQIRASWRYFFYCRFGDKGRDIRKSFKKKSNLSEKFFEETSELKGGINLFLYEDESQ